MFVQVLDALLALAALPVLAASLYLAILAVCARQSRVAVPSKGASALRFDVVVPAHNEEREIGQTVASLKAVDYAVDRFRVIVVADNCTDRTADVAAAAGARVLMRHDLENRGKGQALSYAFRQCLDEGVADAVVVVDADTVVTPNLLKAFAARFENGAKALQADYGVRNVSSSWRTRLMTIALAAFHGVRSLARERLHLSCGLRGNGMAFSQALLRTHPPNAFSIVEDLEYGLQLGYAGIRIEYVHEATVRGYMAVSEQGSRSQRRRWERGRDALVRQHVPRLLGEAWRQRNWMLFDLALDLAVPPLGQLLVIMLVGLALSALAVGFGSGIAAWLWAASLVGLILHVLRAWVVSGAGVSGLLDLMWVPAYVVWKMTLRFRDKGRTPEEWVRTTREAGL
jgi:1,2-diacylglycerol 3-beta-glucosyltransferase